MIPLPIFIGVHLALLIMLFIIRAVEAQNEETIHSLQDALTQAYQYDARTIVELRGMNAALRREIKELEAAKHP